MDLLVFHSLPFVFDRDSRTNGRVISKSYIHCGAMDENMVRLGLVKRSQDFGTKSSLPAERTIATLKLLSKPRRTSVFHALLESEMLSMETQESHSII